MKLNTKLLITYALVGVVLLVAIGLYATVTLRDQLFQSIDQNFISQLYQIDFALTGFLIEVKYDVLDLMTDERVRTRDDAAFTSFLEADEATFEYHIGETEQAIIDIFNTYRLNHPYANSVYMGRENGSFVRSHPRARPTQYDPRARPWYGRALSNPEEVLRTEAYRSVTTPDVNIGTVKALVDESGQVYGVVGIDITLRNLTEYIDDISVGEGSYIVLLDEQGTILTGPDEEALFKHYDEAGMPLFQEVMDNEQGQTWFEQDGQEYYLFYYTSPELGWKISAVIPVQEIDRQVSSFVIRVVALIALALVLLSVLTVIAVRHFIVRPISDLQQSAESVIRTSDLEHQIAVQGRDEVGQLAMAFNEMMASILQAEEGLRASEEQYRGLVENINIGIFQSTPGGQLLHANRAAAQILGYASFEEGIGIMLIDLYKDPHDRVSILDQLGQGKAINDKELCLIKKDGSEVWVSVSLTAQYDQAGEIQWLDGAIEDITVRREAEEALRRARDELERRVEERTAELVETNVVLQQYTAELEERNAELDAFAHTVAHDLKNPMGVVVGYAEALERDWDEMMPRERAEKFLGVIARHGRKMTTIVDELLLLSSVREQEEIDLRPLDMGEIVAEAVERLQDLCKELDGEIVLPGEWPVAVGHSPWVEEVWTNYISNALKYGGRPPQVELGAERFADPATGRAMVRFWVRDDGPGLSPEEQAILFAPFARLQQAQVEGHGLGLSIVRRIVHRLGGKVGVDCPTDAEPAKEGDGRSFGCEFYFTLPERDTG